MTKPKAAAFLVFATVFWGLSFSLVKASFLVQSSLVPFGNTLFFSSSSILFRFSLAAIVLAIFRPKVLTKYRSREWQQASVLALASTGGLLFQVLGLRYTTASIGAFLTQSYIVWIPVILLIHKRKWPRFKVFAAILLVMLGILVLVDLHLSDLKLGLGEFCIIISSIFFAFQILEIEAEKYKSNDFEKVSFLMFLFVALMVLPFYFLSRPEPSALLRVFASPILLLLLSSLGLLATVLSFMLMNYAQRHITATQAGLIYCAEPIFATLFASFLPGLLVTYLPAGSIFENETLSLRLLIGGGLILVANIVAA